MKSVTEVPLLDVAEGIFDGPHATPPESLDGPIFLRLDNITPEGRLDLTDLRYINQSDFPRWTRRVTPLPGDVVFSYEATLHRYVVIPEGFHGCLGRRLALIRPNRKKIEPRYLHYYFLTPRWRAVAGSAVINGATVDRISLTLVRNLPVQLPSLRQQRRIVDILSAYDDLIENNRRRMALLEESARLLYQEWFVRLRFPGHEHVRITNGVPEGWTRESLCEVAEVNRASIGGSFDGEIDYIDIAAVTPGQINETTHYDFKEAPSRARRIVQHGDIIWSCVRPNRKSHAVIWRPSPSLIASTGFAVITPVRVPTSYLLQATTTPDFVGYLENHAKGAAYPAVVAGDFERALVLVPSKAILDVFNDFAEPLFEQLHFLKQQNLKLRAARDLLLPRLMSGEVAV
ncbi:MAG: restriction endonuclease subunit S [Planctomycetaceae bacterium]|nr:restriction endonuclease subunit S [Planctomycetaceae bacterium]